MKAQYLSHYLTDTDVANFARQSFSKLAENFTDAENHSLIKFLARGMTSKDWSDLIKNLCAVNTEEEAKSLAVYLRNIPEHWVPFGHPTASFRMSAPVPIARQAFKHKIGYVESEESRRYITSEPEFFFPPFFRNAADNVKQGSADTAHTNSEYWMEAYKSICEYSKDTYMGMIEDGVCPEQARFVLPQGTKVNWVWTGSLYAYANFYNQRSDSHAQKEIQELAKDIDGYLSKLYPVSWAALTKGVY